MDDLKYLEEHPFKYADGRLDVSMGVCLTCSAMQTPHVLVYMQTIETKDEPPERLEYPTVHHALLGMLRAGYTLANSEQPHPSAWDFIYSVAAWRMMLPGTLMLDTPPKSRPH